MGTLEEIARRLPRPEWAPLQLQEYKVAAAMARSRQQQHKTESNPWIQLLMEIAPLLELGVIALVGMLAVRLMVRR